jgi:hypothetical protein
VINGADQVGKSQACSQLGLIYASSAGGAMRWSGTRARQPALGVGRRPTADRPGVLLAETIRHDGTARISGMEPLVLEVTSGN